MPNAKKRKPREYTFYAGYRGGNFTAMSVAYSKGTHRWIYKVYATSIAQAYALGAREVFAKDAASIGVRSIERDWWHDGVCQPGDRNLAPYLESQENQAP